MDCIAGCGRTIALNGPILYDVFPAPPAGVDPEALGPYCPECFSDTASAAFLNR